MALVDELNQDDLSDVIDESQERSKNQVADDTGVDDAEDEESEEEKSDEDEDEESDEDAQGIFWLARFRAGSRVGSRHERLAGERRSIPTSRNQS